MKKVFWITLTLGIIFILSTCLIVKSINFYAKIYNKIIEVKELSSNALADLDTEYQRRYALVDNLVAITKETREFEQWLIEFEAQIYSEVAKAKASATKMDISLPQEIKTKIKKEQQLGMFLVNALDKLMVMAQRYPEIKDPQLKEHNKTFEALLTLRNELKSIEENILVSRKNFNSYVKNYNIIIKSFPANFIARTHSFGEIEYFEVIDIETKKDVKIQF